jgi:hypothetical protein
MTHHHWKPQAHGGNHIQTMRICETCHQTLHFIIPLEEVENYKTPESLHTHWVYSFYIKWIRGIDHDKTIKTKKVIRYSIPNDIYRFFKRKKKNKTV